MGGDEETGQVQRREGTADGPPHHSVTPPLGTHLPAPGHSPAHGEDVSGAPRQPLVPFGKYLLDEEIASGGMAHVYLARLRGLGGFEKKLVVKQVRPELAGDPQFLALFVQEANTLVQMSHPNVVPVYELGVVDGIYFLAMEYVDGVTLADLLRTQGPLEEALAVHVGVNVAEALSYAHTRFGLVHRDVTPNNVMIDRVGHVRLLDFGIAAPADGARANAVFGSVGYMSPEQVRGEAVTPASDLFSLGTVLVEALTGKNPWDRGERDRTLAYVLGDEPPVISGPTDRPLSPDVVTLLHVLVARDESARPTTAMDVSQTLRSWLSNHRPEGVARTLAQRVDEVLAQQVASRTRRNTDPRQRKEPPGDRAGALRGTTESLATSQTLTALLRPQHNALRSNAPGAEPQAGANTAPPAFGRTAPITGRIAAGERPVAPRSGPRWKTIALTIFGLGVVAWAAAWATRAPRSTGEHSARSGHRAASAIAKAQARGKPGERAALDTRATAHPATEPTLAEPAEPARARATGTLTVNASPWASVSLDRRVLGETPRHAISLEEGNHTVRLDCPPFGTSVTVPIAIESQRNTRVIADMTRDPPTVRLATGE